MIGHRRFRPPTRLVDTLAFCLFTLALLLPAGRALADPPVAIPWRDSLAEAQAEARRRDLPVWIQFTGPWCINCRRLERDAFTYDEVIEHARERFVPVKLRVDEDANEPLAASLGLSSLPATVIARPSGEVILMQQGYADACEFDAFLDSALDREGRRTTRLASRDAPPSPKPAAEPSAPKRDETLALAGYCPVSLVRDRRLTPGRPDLEVRHEGMVFRFADPEHLENFRRSPGPFIPNAGGRSPVSQVDRGDLRPGDPHWGVVYRGHLFLCADDDERRHFLRAPERYARTTLADHASCPQCQSPLAWLGRRTPSVASRPAWPSLWAPGASFLEAALSRPDARTR